MLKKYTKSFISKTTFNKTSRIIDFRSKYFSNQRFTIDNSEREVLETDILIVGGGPAGLSTAIKLAQLAKLNDKTIDITLIDKGEEIGSHILSGNCFEASSLNELIPDWKEREDCPVKTKVSQDKFQIFLNESKSIEIPQFLLPKSIKNHDNYVISLSQLCKWLGKEAEELGVNIFTGFSANQFYSEKCEKTKKEIIKGIITSELGIGKKGNKKDSFQPGNIIKAKQTILAEGCRGSLSERAIKQFELRDENIHQHYGLGLKEVWEVDLSKNSTFQPGLVQHSVYWPTDLNTYSGSFMYHMEPNFIHVGLVVGLNYKNPYLNPYEEFQKLKIHPEIKKYLKDAQCISYGARALNEGGYYALPKLTFPGGMMVGCSAGMLNVAKIKGTHNAIKSGILAAETIFNSLSDNIEDLEGKELIAYQKKFNSSEIKKELYQTRNFHGGFKYGIIPGLIHGAILSLLKGKEFWTLIPKGKDSQKTEIASKHKKIDYSSVKKDGVLTFDILENLSRSGTNHDHDQPIHLVVKDKTKPILSLEKYAAPEERFCPARVYEFVEVSNEEGKIEKQLQINAQNCLHCKCCSIKMVDEYIDWNVPEGGGGPKYTIL